MYFRESFASPHASTVQHVSGHFFRGIAHGRGERGGGPQNGEVNIFKKKGGGEMKSLKNAALALAVLLSFAGCAANSNMVAKDTKIKCPKCGSTFTVDEGLRAIQLP